MKDLERPRRREKAVVMKTRGMGRRSSGRPYSLRDVLPGVDLDRGEENRAKSTDGAEEIGGKGKILCRVVSSL